MRRSFLAKESAAPELAQTAKRRKRDVGPDNEPGKRFITLTENGKDFRIPVSGPKGNWLWEKISNELLIQIIKERIKERGITTRSQLAKSKPYGARIERKANERGLLDKLLPKQENKPKTGNRKPETDKQDRMDRQDYWELRREVFKYWIEDTSWIDELGKKKEN